jgi:hypothetical protein
MRAPAASDEIPINFRPLSSLGNDLLLLTRRIYAVGPCAYVLARAKKAIPMQDYEIRLLTERFTPSLIMETKHMSDQAAILAARSMSHGKPFEVWRGLECIHDTRDTQPIPFRPVAA